MSTGELNPLSNPDFSDNIVSTLFSDGTGKISIHNRLTDKLLDIPPDVMLDMIEKGEVEFKNTYCAPIGVSFIYRKVV